MTSGNDDPLKDLLHSARQRSKTEPLNNTPTDSGAVEGAVGASVPAVPQGLNPLDLLALPQAQRDLVNWLSRQKQATLSQIQTALNSTPQVTAQTIRDLKQAGYVREALVDGHLNYRVAFSGKISRAAQNLPEAIWSRVDLDNSSFLKSIPLFRDLPPDIFKDILGKLEPRTYRRNEVIMWQGEPNTMVRFVKSGIVGMTHFNPHDANKRILSYVKQGEILGFYALQVGHIQSSPVTATALSEVEVLALKREDVFELIEKHHVAALALNQMLIQRVITLANRSDGSADEARLALVVSVGEGYGVTTLGSTLAMTLAKTNGQPTVYTEYPTSDKLPALFGFPAEEKTYTHAGGYQVKVLENSPGIPPAVRATLILDELRGEYPNMVLGLSGEMDDSMSYLLERANQIVILTPPTPDAWKKVSALVNRLKNNTSPDRTRVYIVVNRPLATLSGEIVYGQADLDIPYMDNLPSLASHRQDNLPPQFGRAVQALADRLGRTSRITIYIPKRLEDNPIDTTPFVEKTLKFLATLFKESAAIKDESQRMTSSGESGIISETIYTVRTYVTQSELDKHLDTVLDFAASMKNELDQDALAIEVNHKFMLI
ncbi:MAG: cyclic nucleotide-binding domain-containing protein [Chloroflexi bacterium]|nr:cyclic nucleotide-binding domain-containing protein [Chloroflexota bacterium]